MSIDIGLALETGRLPGSVSWSQVPGSSPGSSLVLDLVVLEQMLPQRDLGGELARAEVAADGVLCVRVKEADVVLQARDVGVILMAINKAQITITFSTNGVDIIYLDRIFQTKNSF